MRWWICSCRRCSHIHNRCPTLHCLHMYRESLLTAFILVCIGTEAWHTLDPDSFKTHTGVSVWASDGHTIEGSPFRSLMLTWVAQTSHLLLSTSMDWYKSSSSKYSTCDRSSVFISTRSDVSWISTVTRSRFLFKCFAKTWTSTFGPFWLNCILHLLW